MRRADLPLSVAVATGISLSCCTSFAQSRDPATADALFRQGRASADAGDYPRACDAFAESQRLDPAPGTLFNLADCEEHLDRLASAESHFLAVVRSLPGSDERATIARSRAGTIAPRVPRMSIALAPDAPAGARVFRDDDELERSHLGEVVALDQGPHGILVVASGHASRRITVVAMDSTTVRVVASVGPAEGARIAPYRTAEWILGVAGVVSLGVGTYFGGRAIAEHSVSDGACSSGICTNATALGAYQSSLDDARVADVALGLGVVAIAVSGYLLLTSRSNAPAETALRVTPAGIVGTW
jgi:hypothetical protein